MSLYTFRPLYSFDERTFFTSSMNLMNSTYAFSSSFCRAASLAARNRAFDERPRLQEGGREGGERREREREGEGGGREGGRGRGEREREGRKSKGL